MSLDTYFLNNIDRSIETVIKADDREHVKDEVSEYVITREIAKKISDFFQAYNDYQGANGVWISGFFGSGKSHLLKILSYVLENRIFNEQESGAVFAAKIETDEMLKGNVQRAVRIPSESVLFNIDQQAQITSKTDANAVLSVFYKVFFDHLGFYGFQPHVAQFESWLSKQNKYEEFKTIFGTKHDTNWEEARIDYYDPTVTDTMAEVLGEIFNKDPEKYENILDEIEEREKQSIQDFCDRVATYVDTKQKGFRLNFFVDEIGQYISDNTKLMLNLQTIAETLATRTKGASWILVTSQEDMGAVVGDMNKQQQNDFSRIQARFGIKIPLTSANVDEVIEKRLLSKKDFAEELLGNVYKKESANLSTLLSFSEAGVQFKGYKNEKDFTNKFPFVPYQFDLFQQCRRALSVHNAFQGKHASVGERSMLGVFQQVAQSIGKEDENALVSFDKMFAGIRNELKGEIQSSIIMAERNLGEDSFAVKVLKTLFMVKYFSNFKTTKRNISVLMINGIHLDIKQHDDDISKALSTLENQSYIQRSNDVYEFLTDDEKDVEQEIKSVDIDETKVNGLLSSIIFDAIIGDNKIKFIDNKQDYFYAAKIDGALITRERELGIEIITPNYHGYDNLNALQMQTMGTGVMRMVLPPDSVFMQDLKMFLRTETYVKQSQSTTNRPELKRILQDKQQQNSIRRQGLRALANDLLIKSEVYLHGRKQETGVTTDGKTKVIKTFQDLIKIVHPSIRMLGSIYYSEDTVRQIALDNKETMFANDDKAISEAETEILNFLNTRKRQSDRTTLLDIKDRFQRKPYGWYNNAIWSIVAKLYKRGKIEMRLNGALLENEDAATALLNNRQQGATVLELQRTDNPKEVKALKECYVDLFDTTISSNVGKEVAEEFKSRLSEMRQEVRGLIQQQRSYPFMKDLKPLEDTLNELLRKEYGYFLSNLKDFADDLLDNKEDFLDPIKKFVNGGQGEIYLKIKTFLSGDTSNFNYIDGEELETLRAVAASPRPYKGDLIKQGKAAKDAFTENLKQQIRDEKAKAVAVAEKVKAELLAHEDFEKLKPGQQQRMTERIDAKIRDIQGQRYIANLRETMRYLNGQFVIDTYNEIAEMTAPAPPPQPVPVAGEKKAPTYTPAPPRLHYIHLKDVRPKTTKTELRNEDEIDAYIEMLRKAMKEEIGKNKRIKL